MNIRIAFIVIFLECAILINTEDCQNPKYAETSHFNDIYLIKKSNYVFVKVYSCSLFINGKFQLDKGDCSQSFHTGVKYVFKVKKHYDIKVNGTVHYSEKIVVGQTEQLLNISITLNEYTAIANLVGNEIKLRSGILCRYNLGKCLDANEPSQNTWDPAAEENNKSIYSDSRIPLENTTSYVVTLTRSPLIQYVVIDKENTSFALRLLKNDTLRFINIWHTDIRDLQVAFKSENIDFFLEDLSTVDSFLERENSLDLQPKELVYDLIMNTCILESKPTEMNNSIPPTIPPPNETYIREKLMTHFSKLHFNTAAQKNLRFETMKDSTAARLLGEDLDSIILMISGVLGLIFVFYVLYNIILNYCILKDVADRRRGRGKMYILNCLSQGLTLRYVYNNLQHEIDILKIQLNSSRNGHLDRELIQRDFNDGFENEYERPLSCQYMI